MQNLRERTGFKILAEPEVTTTSDRQTRMVATMVQTIITNMVFEENHTNAWVRPEPGTIETGPIFDVIPKVLSDGHTIDLSMIASVTTFYGYATPPTNLPPRTATNSAGETIGLPTILPVVRVSRAETHKALFDGQTVVLFPKAEDPVVFNPDEKMNEAFLQGHIWDSEKKSGKKTLVVLVTAVIVDRAGNRVHSDDDLRFANDKIPPQPGAK